MQLSWLSLSERHNGILSKCRKLALEPVPCSDIYGLFSLLLSSLQSQVPGHKTSKHKIIHEPTLAQLCLYAGALCMHMEIMQKAKGPGGGGGGSFGGTPLQEANGDVPLDGVAFL